MNNFKEYVSLNTGFFSFGIWVGVGFVKGIIGVVYGPYSGTDMDMLILSVMAVTPVI